MPERGNITKLPPLVGERAPGFALHDRSGRLFRYPNALGKPLLLVFWAFWCDTWKLTTRAIRQARLRPPYWDGEVWAICADGRWTHRLSVDPVARLIDFPVLLDTGSQVSKRYAIDSVPTLVLVDRTGTVRWRLRGVPKPQWLESAVENLSDPSPDRDEPLYLTFDDFPQPGDENLLDALRHLRLQVTLFAIGRNAERMPELVQRAVAGGHIIGNHSCFHRTAGMSVQAWIQDFEQANRILQRITGQKPRLLRLPGDPNAPVAQQVANALGMQAVGYTVNPYDFARPGTRALVERILAQSKPNGIVLLHCGVRQTVESLPMVVEALRKRFIIGALR